MKSACQTEKTGRPKAERPDSYRTLVMLLACSATLCRLCDPWLGSQGGSGRAEGSHIRSLAGIRTDPRGSERPARGSKKIARANATKRGKQMKQRRYLLVVVVVVVAAVGGGGGGGNGRRTRLGVRGRREEGNFKTQKLTRDYIPVCAGLNSREIRVLRACVNQRVRASRSFQQPVPTTARNSQR